MIPAFQTTEDEMMHMLATFGVEDEADERIDDAMREAQRSFEAFMYRMVPGYIDGWHLKELRDVLIRVERGELKRVIITMPPRHSKSLHVSENFPAWFIGRNPRRRVIAASHTQNLARKFSRRVREKLTSHLWPFPSVALSKDSAGVDSWELSGYGADGYSCVGVGGSPAGLGADLIVIDDPIRNQADADSPVIREALWEWYTGTMYTRRQPDAAIIVTACMTGDTSVTMADGSVTPLRDIRIGDEIATYDNGHLATSRVSNWINHGPDLVYEIRTTSGRVVKANARHPFLVDREGVREWIRVRHLKAGDRLVGVSTGASLAPLRDVTSPRSARATARPTTTRLDGQVATGLRLSITSLDEAPNSNAGTASRLPTTMPCSMSRMASARSVASDPRLIPGSSRPIARMDDCSSITATTPARFADSCVTSAISPSGIATPPKSLNAQPSTSGAMDDPFGGSGIREFAAPAEAQAKAQEFATDEILEIVEAGTEDVFDITVEETENFIAEGVVSHNTRWHEDDLTGRLLEEERRGGEDHWHHLHLPARFDDGKTLWPEFWSDREYQLAESVDPVVWRAQYQGDPRAREGNLLERHWFPYAPMGDRYLAIVQSIDTASQPGISNDWSVITTIGVSPTTFDVLHVWRARVKFPDLLQATKDQALWAKSMWPGVPYHLIIENANVGPALHSSIHADTNLPAALINPPPGKDPKLQRVISVSPLAKNGRIRVLVGQAWINMFLAELSGFPTAVHDDMTDSFTMGVLYASGTGSSSTPLTTKQYANRDSEDDDPFNLSRRKRKPPSPRPEQRGTR